METPESPAEPEGSNTGHADKVPLDKAPLDKAPADGDQAATRTRSPKPLCRPRRPGKAAPGARTGVRPAARDPWAPPSQQPGPWPQQPGPWAPPPGAWGGPGQNWAVPLSGPRPSDGQTNGQAIAAFVLGLLGVAPVSVVLGIVALVRIARTRQRGKGLAIAGLVLSGLWTVLGVGIVVLALAFVATHPTEANGVSAGGPGQQRVATMALGTCFDQPQQQTTDYVTVVPCSGPHDASSSTESCSPARTRALTRTSRSPGWPASRRWPPTSSTRPDYGAPPTCSSTFRSSRVGRTEPRRRGAR
ncbi:DUF4190 domain-containing protein [Streptacidiphilus sp. 4-A2]|nr:DUF4190 domain-containing protein [Streptacidiphilus sp. 4-A2]